MTGPATLRVFNALPGSAVAKGLGFAAVLLTLFFAGRALTDGGAGSSAGDLRLALIHITLTAYSAFAYCYLLNRHRDTYAELEPVLGQAPWQLLGQDMSGKHRWGILCSALVGLVIYLYATEITTTDSDPWDWSQTNYDSRWMRIIGPLFSLWLACLMYVMIAESARLSRLSDKISSLDLLELESYEPLVRLGLTNALLMLGVESIILLFLLEPGFGEFLTGMTILFAIYAWTGLMLPLRGIRRQIRRAKAMEMNWCREALQQARANLKNSTGSNISELVAYKELVEGTRNWPFDNPTLIRFGLYLLIPLASMFGGAFVERALELFLF